MDTARKGRVARSHEYADTTRYTTAPIHQLHTVNRCTHNFIHQRWQIQNIDISVRREKNIYIIYKQKINRCKLILTTAN